MGSSPENRLTFALRLLLRPAARFCLKRSVKIQDLLEAAKVAYLEVASEELEKQEKKVTLNRLSAITGLHKRDVSRISTSGGRTKVEESVAGRVINLWRNDTQFLTKSKRPRVLSYKGPESEFKDLVESISTHLNPGTILFDLERVGAVQKTKNGLKLVKSSYVPRKNPREGYQMLCRDAEELLEAGIDNINSEDQIFNYQASLSYDNIAEQDLPKIRKWFFERCFAFQKRVDKHLAKYDLDLNPDPKKDGGKKVSLGIYTKTR